MIHLANSLPRSTRIAAINRGASLAAERDPVVEQWARIVRVNAVIWKIPIASAALRIVQSLGFKRAAGNGDWYQSLGETVEGGGDCKALSALLVALYLRLGFRAHALWIEEGDQPLDHVAVMVLLEPPGQFVWAEPSINGARLGESPREAARRLGVNVTTTDREEKRQFWRAIDG